MAKGKVFPVTYSTFYRMYICLHHFYPGDPPFSVFVYALADKRLARYLNVNNKSQITPLTAH
jgi:hypothetical protein